jgi:hypothetical protein
MRAAQPFEASMTVAITMVAVGVIMGLGLYFMIAGFLYWRDIQREKQQDEQRRR